MVIKTSAPSCTRRARLLWGISETVLNCGQRVRYQFPARHRRTRDELHCARTNSSIPSFLLRAGLRSAKAKGKRLRKSRVIRHKENPGNRSDRLPSNLAYG
jgi:hypothetical protein